MAVNAPLQIDILELKLTTSATSMLQVGCPRICFSKNNVLIDHTIFSEIELFIVEHNQQEAYKEVTMRHSKLSLLVPYALLLSACTIVMPVYKDNGTHSGSCVEGGPDSVARQFYDYHIQRRNNDITALRLYLSDNLAKLLTDASRDNAYRDLFDSDPFSSCVTSPNNASAASASTIPNSDARSIPLRVELRQGDQSWRDGVLMIHEGQCWVVDDVHYLGSSVHTPVGTLRQSVEDR